MPKSNNQKKTKKKGISKTKTPAKKKKTSSSKTTKTTKKKKSTKTKKKTTKTKPKKAKSGPQDLDYTTHAQFNTFPKLLTDDDTIGSIRFWDVGTGNCNTLYDRAGQPLIYFDFGGNMGTGAKTYPYKGDPKKKDTRPAPPFPHTNNKTSNNKVLLVMSHWDEDHIYSLKAKPDMNTCPWLGPREDIAPRTAKLVAKLGKSLRIWAKTDSSSIEYESKKNVKIRLVRCLGNTKASPSSQHDRNDTGVAMIVEVKTPTRAEAAAQAIEEHAKANPGDAPGALQKGRNVDGDDVFKECVIAAAEVARITNPTSATAVSAAARAYVTGFGVKGATAALIAMVDAAHAKKAEIDLLGDATIAMLRHVALKAHRMLDAMRQAGSKSATQMVTDGIAMLFPPDDALMKCAMAAVVAAVANKSAQDVLQDAVHAAGTSAGVPPVAAVLLAIQNVVQGNGTAADAAAAGVNAVSGSVEAAIGREALRKAWQTNDPLQTYAAAVAAAIDDVKPFHPMFRRAIEAALNKSGNVVAKMKAAIETLKQGPEADGPAAVMKMKVRLLEKNPTNASLDEAIGKPEAGKYYAHAVLKAVRRKIEESGKTNALQAIFQAGFDALENPKEWMTRMLLTGDACFQALPPAELKKKEWDVLLAYHHGSRDGFADGKPSGNRHDAPLPVLKGISTIAYSAGKREDGTYVFNHPEAEALKKYQAAGWTVELHTHEWKTDKRGMRDFKLPYMK